VSGDEELFGFLDDLEGRAEAVYDAERAPEIADRGRAEYQSVTLAARLMASAGRDLTLELRGAGPVTGRLARLGDGWCLLDRSGQEWVVRLAAVTTVLGASSRAVPEVAWPAVAGLGLRAPLRRLEEAAEPCRVHLVDGRTHDGTLRRVGSDFVELSTGEAGRIVLLSLAHVAAIHTQRT
jgi:hypothetical protein